MNKDRVDDVYYAVHQAWHKHYRGVGENAREDSIWRKKKFFQQLKGREMSDANNTQVTTATPEELERAKAMRERMFDAWFEKFELTKDSPEIDPAEEAAWNMFVMTDEHVMLLEGVKK